MNDNIWTYIKADRLFKNHIPEVKNYKNKIRGKDTRGKEISFTPKEKRLIARRINTLTRIHLHEFKDI